MAEDLRQRVAEALAHAECEKQPRCVDSMADAAMAVRDEEMEDLRAELTTVEGQRDDHRKALKSVGAERDRLREAARIVTENRWYERLAQAEQWRERAEKAELVIARAENLRDKWLAWPTGDMHHAAGLMLAKYLSDEPPAPDDTAGTERG